MAIDEGYLDTFKNSYNEVPYIAYSSYQTSPAFIHSVANLFNVKAPPLEKARVLELGCSDGGNLINFAINNPKSQSIGIDLSPIQIKSGKDVIKALGIKNFELKEMSILDIKEDSFEKFDYIICHGVLSWVPEIVRNKIFELSKKLLNPNGIAYLSYNVKPGWNMVNTIREMMLFHSSIFENTEDKIRQARLSLNFITDSLEGTDSAYAKFLRQETAEIKNRDDQYIRHEYLAEENISFYFHEIIEIADSQGLKYLGDADYHTMFLGNLPEKASIQLSELNSLTKTEQYMDFIYNRRFRASMLCHPEVEINRNINLDKLYEFYISISLTVDKEEKDIDINDALDKVCFNFVKSLNANIVTSSSALKALFYTMMDNEGNPLKSDELINYTQKKYKNIPKEQFKESLDYIIVRIIFGGFANIFTVRPKSIYKISEKPKVSKQALHQIKNTKSEKVSITNEINNIVGLNAYEKYILEFLDGTHNINDLEEIILEKFNNKELVANYEAKDGNKDDSKFLTHIAKKCVEAALERFKRNYLLIA